MSLWCGNCRREIFFGFGLLYRLERNEQGVLRYPDKTTDYVPPNSAVCSKCWRAVPAENKLQNPDMKQAAEDGKLGAEVFIFAGATSNNDKLWGSKTWSGIQADEETSTFISSDSVSRFLPKVLEIIVGSTREKAASRKSNLIAALLTNAISDRELQRISVRDESTCELRFRDDLVIPVHITYPSGEGTHKHGLTLNYHSLLSSKKDPLGWSSQLTKEMGGKVSQKAYINRYGNYCEIIFYDGTRLHIDKEHPENDGHILCQRPCLVSVTINDVSLDCWD